MLWDLKFRGIPLEGRYLFSTCYAGKLETILNGKNTRLLEEA